MSASTGFMSGLIEGQDAQLRMAEGQQKLAMGGIKLKEEDVALQQAEIMLANQRKFAAYMAKISGAGGDPGQNAGDMANQLASRLFAVSDAALRSNMPEQAAEILTKAEAVQKGHIELETATFQQQLERSTLVSNLIKDLDPDAPNATDEFHQRMLIFSGMTGSKPNQEYMNSPFTKELKERLLTRAETRGQEASRKLEEQRLKQSNAETVVAEKRAGLVDEQRRLDEARRKNIEKAGGHTKAEQKQVDALSDVSSDIDDMLDQLEKVPANKSLTGIGGTWHSFEESVATTTGIGDQATPAHDFETTMSALRTKLPRAMTGAGRSNKDEREAANVLADLRRPGISPKIAKERLKKLKDLIQAQITRSGVKPSGEEPIEGPKTDDKDVDVSNW